MDWIELAGKVLHPAQVAIIEAVDYIGSDEGRSISAAEFARMCDGEWAVPQISYHVRALAKLGVLELRGTRAVRGAIEHYYGLVG